MADYTPLFVEPDVSALFDFFVAKGAVHGCLLNQSQYYGFYHALIPGLHNGSSI